MVQLSKDEIIKITQRLQNVRQGLVQKAPVYAILLFGLRFSLDDMVERVYTDGERIAFNPDFLKEISDKELEFIMLHEVSHVALGHPFRCVHDYDIEIFDEACDIVVNSNIYHYMGDDESFITVKGLGVMPHKNNNGEEGYRFTVEQVYEHLFKIKGKKKKADGIILDSGIYDEEGSNEDDELETIDEDEVVEEKFSDEENNDAKELESNEANSEETEEDGQDGGGSNAESGDQTTRNGNGKRGKNRTNASKTGGGSSSQSNSKGKGGVVSNKYKKALESINLSQIKSTNDSRVIRFDDHSFWKGEDKQNISKASWESRVLQTYETIKNAKLNPNVKGGFGWGNAPCFAERLYQEITDRKLDWKTLLNDFIQEDVCDYSFSPPDRRFGDSDFFLPDFNEKEETVENLLFMIDTSGSMSDTQISEVYSEIRGAIEQFNGRVKGWLGFFDAIVTEPKEFNDEQEFKTIRIQGGGGTAFLPIFHYVRDYMKDKNITSIIILTDGYAPYPEEYERMDIPVLWIINNEEMTPPWGMVARIPQKNNDEII